MVRSTVRAALPALLILSAADAASVIVVGAGVSGMSAARTLLDNLPGVEVTVFEARARLGGRTWTQTPEESGWASIVGGEADMGASWIHGSSADHPISRIKDLLGWATFETLTNKAKMFQCATGVSSSCSEAPSRQIDSSLTAFRALLTSARSAGEQLDKDTSFWAALQGKTSNGFTRDSPDVAHWLTGIEFNYGAPLDQISVWYGEEGKAFRGQELVLQKGYGQLARALQEGAVKLNRGNETTVEPSKPSGAQVAAKVVYKTEVTKVEVTTRGVTVTTKDGSSQSADYAVVTVPLGVLKSGSIQFVPALPANTVNAVASIGMGNVVKSFFLFNEPFWDTSVHYYLVAQGGVPDRGLYTQFVNFQPAVGRPVLLSVALGDAAEVAEKFTDKELWAAARANMVKIWGDAVPAEAAGITRSKWRSDPFARGAYSFMPVGAVPDHRLAFQTPVASNGHPRLFFAGEHTSKDYPATVHGAFLSGQLAARNIMKHSLMDHSTHPTQAPGSSTVKPVSTAAGRLPALCMVAALVALAHALSN